MSNRDKLAEAVIDCLNEQPEDSNALAFGELIDTIEVAFAMRLPFRVAVQEVVVDFLCNRDPNSDYRYLRLVQLVGFNMRAFTQVQRSRVGAAFVSKALTAHDPLVLHAMEEARAKVAELHNVA